MHMDKTKRSILYILAALVAAAIAVTVMLLVSAPKDTEGEKSTVELWYADTDLMTSRIAELTRQYNSGQGLDDGVSVRLKAFDSEGELFEALSGQSGDLPDMVLCDTNIAASLFAEGRLADLSDYTGVGELIGVSDELLKASKCDGELAAIPIGAVTWLLMCDRTLCGGKLPTTFEQLCNESKAGYAANGESYFAVKDYAYFFRNLVAQLGGEFDGLTPHNTDSTECKYVYNSLAEAAYERGLDATAEDPAQLVAKGKLACAVASTADIMSAAQDNGCESVIIGAFPVPEGRELRYALKCTGAAVLSGSDEAVRSSMTFIKWLSSGENISELTSDTGYIPARGDMSCSGAVGKDVVILTERLLKNGENYMPYADATLGGRLSDFDATLTTLMSSLN